MKKTFSTQWKSSTKPRKQRKYAAKAPLHIKQKFMRCHLNTLLSKKYGRKTVGLRTGDKVTVQRGDHKKKEGKVERIDLKRTKVYVTGIEGAKKDGTKYRIGIHPSNLLITDVNTSDKKRKLGKQQNDKKPSQKD